MVKKLNACLGVTLLLTLGLMASDVSAAERFRRLSAEKTYPQGFYVGGYGGLSFPEVNSLVGPQFFEEVITGGFGGGFLGYRVLVPRGFYHLYFAVESDIGVHGAEFDEQEAGNVTANIDINLQYGADFLFGYKDEAWLIFARGGWQRTRFDSTFTDDDESTTSSAWENGIRFGGGIDYGMRRWFLRVDYRRVIYSSQNGVVPMAGDYRFKWTDNQTHIGIGYRF